MLHSKIVTFIVPLPLLAVIYHKLEVTAAYYNIKMLASHLENAQHKQTSEHILYPNQVMNSNLPFL